MSIKSEMIPSSRSSSSNPVRSIPRGTLYGTIALSVLIVVGILKTLLPLIVMGLILGLIWKQAKIN